MTVPAQSNVTPLRKCGECGEPARPRTLVYREGEPDMLELPFYACDACIASSDERLAKERLVFEALLAAGVDRATANVMMIAKHDYEAELK